MAEENGQDQMLDLSGLGSFDFAPSWATGDKVVAKAGHGGEFRDYDEDRAQQRESRPPRRFDKQKGSDERRQFDREDRDRPRKPFNRGAGDPRRQQPDRDSRDGGRFGAGKRGFAKREYVKPLDADIRVLPGQKELGGIIRKIQTSFMAYPLKQIAWFFLDHPEACHVKVTPKDPEVKFFVCKACGHSCFSMEALETHILSEHLKDYYVAEEMDVEPPAGQFGCVVKCGITGEFIGPPNLHGYNSAVREMAQRLGMSESAYRAKLVTVHDQESVEAWRRGATKKTFYHLKVAEKSAPVAGGDNPDGEASKDADSASMPLLERDQAEASFRRDIMPQLKSVSKSSDMSLDKALKSEDLPYLFAVRDAISRERRFPASLFFSLRGAFHHRKLSFFRANEQRGQEFVCMAKPVPLDTEHAIPELGAVVKFVEEHPLCHVNELPPEMKGHLGWLVEKGHVVQYFNGLLAMPEEHPKFRNQPSKAAVASEKKVPVPEAKDEAAAPEAAAPEVAPETSVETALPEVTPEATTSDAAPETNVEEKKEDTPNEVADKLAE